LARKLVAVSTDGASVMTGVHNGVSARLSQIAPFLLSIRCMAHRTDLAVAALEKAPIAKGIVGAIKDVYNYFSGSFKRVSIFEEHGRGCGNQRQPAEADRGDEVRNNPVFLVFTHR
jgi:hypothetical protein